MREDGPSHNHVKKAIRTSRPSAQDQSIADTANSEQIVSLKPPISLCDRHFAKLNAEIHNPHFPEKHVKHLRLSCFSPKRVPKL